MKVITLAREVMSFYFPTENPSASILMNPMVTSVRITLLLLNFTYARLIQIHSLIQKCSQIDSKKKIVKSITEVFVYIGEESPDLQAVSLEDMSFLGRTRKGDDFEANLFEICKTATLHC